MPSQTYTQSGVPALFNGVLSSWSRMSPRPVKSGYFPPFDPLLNISSPNPSIPPPKAYGPPLPPSAKDLGPPPPGYGRHVDLGNGVGPPGSNNTMTGPPRRNLDEVLCFKVGPFVELWQYFNLQFIPVW